MYQVNYYYLGYAILSCLLSVICHFTRNMGQSEHFGMLLIFKHVEVKIINYWGVIHNLNFSILNTEELPLGTDTALSKKITIEIQPMF